MNSPELNLADMTALEDFVDTTPAPTLAGDFVELTKARLNFMVLITAMIGFVVAPPSDGTNAVHWGLLLNTLIGTALAAAGASVLNQAWERDLDKKMHRTADRPVAGGRMSRFEAAQLGILMSVLGTATLAITVNVLAAGLALSTVVLYVLVYTPLKTRTTLNTLVGAVPGAVPPLIGFAAASGTLNWDAAALFAILFCWQMPHFLAIAILCRDDYAAAGFKMLPVVDEKLTRTSTQMVLWCLLLIWPRSPRLHPRGHGPVLHLGVNGPWHRLPGHVRPLRRRPHPPGRPRGFFRIDHLPAAGAGRAND